MSKKKLPFRSQHANSITSGSSISKVLLLFSQIPTAIKALPVIGNGNVTRSGQPDTITTATMTAQEFYVNLITSMVLVLLGGVFAGLTLGLMGQDEVYLKVIASSGEKSERAYARKVLRLIGRGKHWVLVTLLLSNVITNETLPIVLDRCLGGGWPAVVASTASIVIFGEIIPQSICVRYGLQVGAMFAPFVLTLMYIMYPVAYPCSLLLDHILGEDHGTVYKKSGLKTLVTLHQTMGVERLNEDEVTIISAVLDLKEKPVSHIMTPMDRVYTMSADTILDEDTVEEIFNAGFSRIPIHLPNEPLNFIGMLLVRVLISYDPEDALPVASFPLATLPETGAETSCLNILNYFQEGKSHMIIVSEHPGEPVGAMGVLTLEDVIEELIGEEIVDESDVYVDINKNIKRTQPGPLSKRSLTAYLHGLYQRPSSKRNSLDESRATTPLKGNIVENPAPPSPKLKVNGATGAQSPMINSGDAAKVWKPKNPASNPLATNKSFVKIKRTDMELVKNSYMPPNKGKPNEFPGYGAIHATEEDALSKADDIPHIKHGKNGSLDAHEFHIIDSKHGGDVSYSRNSEELDQDQDRDPHLHPDPDSDPVSLDGPVGPNGPNGSNEGPSPKSTSGRPLEVHYNNYDSASKSSVPEYTESRSYRTGGIIESVINVQGVHKTIIEHISDEENVGSSIASLPNSRNSSKSTSIPSQYNGTCDAEDVEEHLLSDFKKHLSPDTPGKRLKHGSAK